MTTVLEEEYQRSIARQKVIHQAKEHLRRYRFEGPDPNVLYDAMIDIVRVVDMLSASEERTMRLHAECHAMLEQGAKILTLDASLRPVIVKVTEGPGEDKP